LTVLLVSVFNFIIWENQSELITRNQQLTAENLSVRLSQKVRNSQTWAAGTADSTGFTAFAKSVAQSEGVEGLTIFTEMGKVLFTREAVAPESLLTELPLVQDCIREAELRDKDFLHDIRIQDKIIRLYIPRTLGDGSMAVFRFPLPIQGLEKDRDVLLRLCLLVTAFVVFLQLVFAAILRKLVIVPIAHLEGVTHEIAKGDFTQRIEIRQNDEIGHLASSFNEMMLNLVRIREEAKGSNPLTGLPGNNNIVAKIEEMIHHRVEFSVIYGDLDNFKAYNDKYGFSKGDDAILFTRDCFLEAGRRFGDASTFIGHEGGDDFVSISSFESWEAICKGVCAAFDDGVRQFYSEADANQGFIDSVDRQGKKVRFPLMSISLAVASNHFRTITDHRMIVQIAAEMKKFVKKKTGGSNYAIDKRIN
jgi:GGDEF domain-containing protein